MKKRNKIIIFIFAIGICITGCAQLYGKQTDKGKEENESKHKELILWSYYETDGQKRALDELVEGFNEYQDRYLLKWKYQGPTTSFSKKIAIGITQKQQPDMVIIDNPDMRKYIEQDGLEDMTPYISQMEGLDEYYPNVLSSVIYDQKYYGLPFCCNNAGLIYNKDIFKDVGLQVPRTWEEFLEAAQILTKDRCYGFAMSAMEGQQAAFQILPWILTAGDSVDTLGGQGTNKAFQLISRLVETNSISKDCINWSQNDVARKFISGECAMMENGPWVLPSLNESGINYGIARLPISQKSISVTGGENIAVLKGKNVEGAAAFLEYYNKDSNMLNVSLQSNSLPPKEKLAKRVLSVKPEYKIFVEQMADCVTRSDYDTWPKVTGLLSDAQLQVITGKLTPDEVCRIIEEQRK